MIQQSRAFHRLEGDTTVTGDKVSGAETSLLISCLEGSTERMKLVSLQINNIEFIINP